MGIQTLFFDLAETANDIIASDSVARAWNRDSALPGYTVGGLCSHLARAVLTVDTYLDEEPTDHEATLVDAAEYFARILQDHDPVTSRLHRSIRERSQQSAEQGPGAVASAARSTLERLRSRIDEAALHQVVDVRGGLAMHLEEYLRTRLVELVVHLDDVAASLPEATTPEVATDAYVETAGVLGRLAALRAGGVETVRSLARAERHPDAVRAL